MAHPQAYQIRDSPLTWAIRSIRRRLHLGQVGFTRLLLGKYVSGQISRWESGQVTPRVENLLRLLRVAETPEEAAPIRDALKAQGFDQTLTGGVQPFSFSFPGAAPVLAADRAIALPTISVSGGIGQNATSENAVSADRGAA